MNDNEPLAGPPTLEFIGTATTILRLGPFTVLTDPNFLHEGQRAYLGHGLSSRRLTEPSRQPADLPPIDLVVLSHLHGDHFDRIARRELDRTLPVYTTPNAASRLREWGFGGAIGLATWRSTLIERGAWSLEIRSTPGQHAPSALARLLPAVMGCVLTLTDPEGQEFRTYLSGDTLYRPWLAEITERCGRLDAAVVHLGGTRILGVTVTMDGEQGADLVQLLEPRVAVPVHHDDYTVFRSPLGAFLAACQDRDLGSQVRVVGRGDVVPLEREPWA